MSTAPTPASPVPTFELVAFEGADIMAARCSHDGEDQIFVPMKRFCGTLGLPWDGARRRIERDEVLREGAVMMTVPSPGGAQLQQTLPLDLIPGFLLGAESSRYAPELRERIKAYRRQCYAVLFKHFYDDGAVAAEPLPVAVPEMPAGAAPAPPINAAAAIGNAMQLVDRLRLEPPGPVRILYAALFEQTCRQIGQDAPLVAPQPAARPTARDLLDAFLTALRTLDARRVSYNHLGDEAHGRIAVNLPELGRLFAQHDIDVPIDAALRAALHAGEAGLRVQLRVVESRIARRRRPTLCHVIERTASGL